MWLAREESGKKISLEYGKVFLLGILSQLISVLLCFTSWKH